MDVHKHQSGQGARVFIAATPAEWLPRKVLEFSIRECSLRPVEIAPIDMFGIAIPSPVAAENRPRTPFSFQRFLIPGLCKYQGAAIYLDADMLVFGDIADLWEHQFEGHDLLTVKEGGRGRRGQFSVMLLDCRALGWDITKIVSDLDAGVLDYPALMYDMQVANNVGRIIDEAWNSLESYEHGKTKLLHYTDMNTQPWVSTSNPLGYLWVGYLRRAVSSGVIAWEDIEREVRLGHVRPSLHAQLKVNVDDTLVLPRSIARLDRAFVPPYKRLSGVEGKPWTSLRSAVTALLRRGYYRSRLPRIFG